MQLIREKDFYRKQWEDGEGKPTKSRPVDEVLSRQAKDITGTDQRGTVPYPLERPSAPSRPRTKESTPDRVEDVGVEGSGRLLRDESGVSRELGRRSIHRCFQLMLTVGYMGDISGAAFYTALLQVLRNRSSQDAVTIGPHAETDYQTWDSRSLPTPGPIPGKLPTLRLVKSLISVFFHHTTDHFSLLDAASFEAQINRLYISTGLEVQDLVEHNWILIQLYCVLSISSLYIDPPLDEHEICGFRAPPLLGISATPPGYQIFGCAMALLPNLIECTGQLAAQTLCLMVRCEPLRCAKARKRMTCLSSRIISCRSRTEMERMLL